MSSIFERAAKALDAVDAAIDSRCGHCSGHIPPESLSAYYCGPDCQQAWARARATDPGSVRGSDYTFPDQVRWAPNMVTHEPDDDDLALEPHPPADLRYDGRYNATVYRRRSTRRWHLRLDDGCRFVGRDLAEASPDDVWRTLERQLTDERLADRQPIRNGAYDQLARLQLALSGALGRLVDAVPASPRVVAHARGRPQPSRHTHQASPASQPPEWVEIWAWIRAYDARINGSWPLYRWCPACFERSRIQPSEPVVRWPQSSGPTTPAIPATPVGNRCGQCHASLPTYRDRAERDPETGVARYHLTLLGYDALTLGLPTPFSRIQPCQAFGYIEGEIIARVSGRPGADLHGRLMPRWRAEASLWIL